ncbi:uncharacterized protein LOC110032736 [Phalaenopsis equestris]|uniref:uncharacterized protein LOC110032736 n=1 Tax=Phalaenopsis equestris TaxID=78828 RepID=UPI0009E5FCD2|nr:uncharacterized protein LOC110032736 [Phalaenopsis equestris]
MWRFFTASWFWFFEFGSTVPLSGVCFFGWGCYVLTFGFSVFMNGMSGYVTFVYARCNKASRTELWSVLHSIYSNMTDKWMVGRDFNCIAISVEKIGGRSLNISKLFNFSDNIQAAHLFDLGFNGPPFTWKWGKIWERLNKYLNIWFDHPSFTEFFAQQWKGIYHEDRLIKLWPLHLKISKALRTWGWNTFGNILLNVEMAKREVKTTKAVVINLEADKSSLITAQEKLLTAID